MNSMYVLLTMTSVLFAGVLSAQSDGEGTTIAEEWAATLAKHDHDKDEKITLAEVKQTASSESEGASELDVLNQLRFYLVEYLSVDTNDNKILTRKEFDASYTEYEEGKKPQLSADDWSIIVGEYVNPYLELTFRVHDKDGDKAINEVEAEAIADFTVKTFAEVDTDEDGRITADEFKQAYKDFLGETYEINGDAADSANRELIENVKKLFAERDQNGDGFWVKSELEATTDKSVIANWWALYIAFLAMDVDDDMKLSYDEYLASMIAYTSDEKAELYPVDRKAAMKEVWAGFDANEDGKVVESEYKARFPDTEEFEQGDTNKDGFLTKDEFWELIRPDLEANYVLHEKDRPEAPVADPSDGADDASLPFSLYRKKGRSWTLKSVNGEVVIFLKSEVIEVGDGYARVRTAMLDEEGRAYMGIGPTVEKIMFIKTEPPAEDLVMVEKTVNVKAGEYECVGYKKGDSEVVVWTHKKYPNLLVKTKTLELVLFKE